MPRHGQSSRALAQSRVEASPRCPRSKNAAFAIFTGFSAHQGSRKSSCRCVLRASTRGPGSLTILSISHHSFHRDRRASTIASSHTKRGGLRVLSWLEGVRTST